MRRTTSEFHIGKETSAISSGRDPTPPAISTAIAISTIIQAQTKLTEDSIPIQDHLQLHSQPHVTILIPSTSSSSTVYSQQNSANPPFQPDRQDHNITISGQEQVSDYFPPCRISLSTPEKRCITNPSPSKFSYSRSVSPPCHYRRKSYRESSASPTFPCRGSFTIPSLTKFVTLIYLCPLSCSRLLAPHFRILIGLSLLSFYFLVSNPRRSVLIDLLSVLAFSTALLFSLNLAFPRLPSIRLFLARSLPVKLRLSFCATKPSRPVLWSIGPEPKSEKKETSGCWVQVYCNGDVYEGEFHKGKCTGSGVYHYHMSGRYEGDWVDDKYDGYGVETWARGSRYRGQYKQGLRHGIGVYRFYTGDVYSGEWSNGQCHGFGVHTCDDGSRYIGEFKWGLKHGHGYYHFRNGDIYAGEYFADKMHGFGIYRFGNGHLYEGAWHEGRRQGLGIYTFKNGETQCGHWQNGVVDIPSTQNVHHASSSSYAVKHSRVVHAVQEARKAGERAYDVNKFEERVNRSVCAANKAANAGRVAAVKAVQNRMYA